MVILRRQYKYQVKITEYTDVEDGSTLKKDEETEAELDNMKQYIGDLKEEIEIEKAKIKCLNEATNKQKKILKLFKPS